MAKKKRKLKLNINQHVLLFIVFIFIIGVIFGTIYSHRLENNGVLNIVNDIQMIIYNVDSDHALTILLKSFGSHFIYLFLIWVLALTLIGIPLIVFMVFFIGFIYGFVISFFIIEMGTKGITFALIYTFPQNLIILPLTIYVSYSAITCSVNIYYLIYKTTSRKQLKNTINAYFNILLFAIVTLVLYSLIVLIVNPYLLNSLKLYF
ncbi:stage II sporulation protein M [Haloplasma contractile]|uniref:Sporulation protein n=1 Tax=Haloplasma contractile SSD-17B TaxID=1033810 RepID=U2FS29_9MOLU|nr:stage II sporulation protein M [Haloplasma contractile]ERJ13764.1 Putative sporulation protein [Haloplasma contractile SSD-17B]